MKQTWKRIGSLILSVCMMLTMLPTVALAEDSRQGSGALLGISGEIIAFADLDKDVSEQAVETGTAEDELNLPDTLTVTVTTGAAVTADGSGDETAADSDAQEPEVQKEEIETTVAVSEWTSDPEYDGDTAGSYTFTPALSLPDGLTVAEGVNAPTITVTVEEAAETLAWGGVQPLGATESGSIWINGTEVVSDIGSGTQTGTNWSWDSSSATLTLSGSPEGAIWFNTAAPVNLVLSASATIENTGLGYAIKSNGDLTIGAGNYTLTASSTDLATGYAIYTGGDLDITGSGAVTATGKGDAGFALRASGTITISGSANVMASSADGKNYAIISIGDLTVSESASLNSAAIDNSDIYSYAGISINTTGTVTARSSAEDYAVITASRNINIQNGAVTATSTAANGDGIYSESGDLSISGGTVTATGAGTGYALNACNGAGTVNISNGTVTAANTSNSDNVYSGTLNHTGGTLNGKAPVNTAVTTEAELQSALESGTPSTITLGNNITMNTNDITLGANHTLNTGGKTLTITGGKAIRTNRNALTVNGGGTVMLANTIYHGIRGTGSDTDALNLENVTVNLENTGTSGGLYRTNITVGNNAAINLNAQNVGSQINIDDSNQTLSINTGGVVNVNHFAGAGINNSGTIHINGGALNLGTGSSNNWGILNQGGGLLKYTSGTLTPGVGAAIHLVEGSKVYGMSGHFTDRGTLFTEAGQVAVGEWNTEASANSLTVGTYFWTGSVFEKNVITLTAEPQDITVAQGTITGSLTAAGTAGNGNSVSYQWYDADYNPIAGATDSSFSIPTDLTAGTHKYGCKLTANGCDAIWTREVIVTVNPAGVTPVTGITLNRTTLSLYSNTTPSTADLTATVAPSDATDKTVTWQSSKPSVATVDTNGKVTAVGNGTAVITATTTDGGHTASCTVTVTTYSGGGGNGGSGSGSSSTSSSSSTTTITTGKAPDQPVTAAATVTATAGTNGAASASIPEKAVTDAIAKAQADAKAQGKTANGTSVALNVTMPQGATSLTATLTRNSLNSLVSAGVTSLELNGSPVTVSFDKKALAEIQKQSSGNINITIAPNASLSDPAKAMIGTRPVYDITVGYGSGKTVSSFGAGTATVSIPYTLGKNEAVGGLYAVYVDAEGNATRITGSAYDANTRSVIFTTPHFSLYGVGYTAPSAKFTDISTHWGKESIDYAVGRGLLSGTTETTFAPDTAMTRGMLVTALGRLTGVDTKLYTTNSFTDVKADSAFRPYIEWAYKKGIIQGIGNQQFAPDRAITREEIAVIISNYAKATSYTLPVTREAATYADASSIGSVYKTAVTAMQQAGIMMGGTDNKFNPKGNATRAEVSAMLHRYIKLTIDPATAQGWAQSDAGQYLYYKDGKVLTGTQTIDGTKYFFNTDGTLKTGWVKDGDNWRFYSGNVMPVSFWDIGANGSNKTYYFDTYGNMVSGKWLQIDGKWYYFYADGSLARSTTVDGYEVDENGVRKAK